VKDQSEHIFINNTRICGMAAIVMVHSIGGYLTVVQESAMPILAMILCQLCKFGTVAFFIASGFLTGERIERVRAGEYLKRRMHNVFLPWLFWCVLWCVTVAVFDGLRGRLVIAGWKDVAWAALRYTKVGLFGSPFWFVPNLLLAITMLLISKRFLSDSLIGVASAILSLLYGINIYARWILAAHMEALGGFIFYLWLGMWGARNQSFLHERISRITTKYFLLAALLTGITKE
jgi:fucose 4-O-acetylase-like acetyltransferase